MTLSTGKRGALFLELQPFVFQRGELGLFFVSGVQIDRLFVSAATGEGLAGLRQLLSLKASRTMPLAEQDDSIPLEFPAQWTPDAL